MHDCTRDNMSKLLLLLEGSLLEQIREEEKKANIEKLRKFFKACEDNAVEIAEMLNIDQIFADR